MGGQEYNRNEAIVCDSNLTSVAVMAGTPIATVKSIMGRMGIQYGEGYPKDVYLTALVDYLHENRELVLMILPEYILNFLMKIWENDQVRVAEEEWGFAEYLKILGFIAYRRGNSKTGAPNEIHRVSEAKEEFYFLIKSRSSRMKISRYSGWEKMVTGLMYYYGFINIVNLHEQFLKVSGQLVSYDEFLSFIKCRCSLWAFGEIMRDIAREKDYFSYMETDNPETMLLFISQHPDIPYKKISYDDLVYISEAAGIDNRWPGISELGTLFVHEMDMDYYKATVMLRSLIRMIHNGDSFDRLKEKVSVLPASGGEREKEMMKGLRLLYDHVPLFEYKGYNRHEYNELFYEKQLKKKSNLFTIIDGGCD